MEDYKRTNFSSGRIWEESVGYSRAIRIGRMVRITGTMASLPDGSCAYPDDAYRQTRHILEAFVSILGQMGLSKEHLVQTKIFATRKEDFGEIGRAHKEVLDPARPCATMLQISGLTGEGFVVEIEAEAYIHEGSLKQETLDF